MCEATATGSPTFITITTNLNNLAMNKPEDRVLNYITPEAVSESQLPNYEKWIYWEQLENIDTLFTDASTKGEGMLVALEEWRKLSITFYKQVKAIGMFHDCPIEDAEMDMSGPFLMSKEDVQDELFGPIEDWMKEEHKAEWAIEKFVPLTVVETVQAWRRLMSEETCNGSMSGEGDSEDMVE